MIKLNLRRLEPGMILAEPAYNFQGVLLLDKGAELSEKNIRIFKSWGVKTVCIEGDSKEKRRDNDGRHDNGNRSAIEKALKLKFSDVPDHPAMTAIMRVAARILEERSLMKEGEDEIR